MRTRYTPLTLTWTAAAAAAAALALTTWLYARPDMAVLLAGQLWACFGL